MKDEIISMFSVYPKNILSKVKNSNNEKNEKQGSEFNIGPPINNDKINDERTNRNNTNNTIDTKPKRRLYELNDLINLKVEPKSIVYIELVGSHLEVIPGYAKYFLDLGYNVNVLQGKGTEGVFNLFPSKYNLKIFTFKNRKDVIQNSSKIAKIFSMHDHIVLGTMVVYSKQEIDNLNFLKHPGAFYVSHDIKTLGNYEVSRYYNSRFFVLANFTKGVFVNPHYFGDILPRRKNKKTNFLITSSHTRSYENLKKAIFILKERRLDFTVTVIGKYQTLAKNTVPKAIQQYFNFKLWIPYRQVNEELMNSDYILILLDPNCEYGKRYGVQKATGSAQSAYGFLKPPIINDAYSKLYMFNSSNSFLYKRDEDIADAMAQAILASESDYNKMVNNLSFLSKKIYDLSLNNLIRVLNSKT